MSSILDQTARESWALPYIIPNACSCLTLIVARVIYWQAREISRIAVAPDFPFDPELIARISPIEWRNIVLYGEIKIDPSKLRVRGP